MPSPQSAAELVEQSQDWPSWLSDAGQAALAQTGSFVQNAVVRPAAMPVQMVTGAGQHITLQALALSLPSVFKTQELQVKAQLEARLRAYADGKADPNELLLDPLVRQLYKLVVKAAPKPKPKARGGWFCGLWKPEDEPAPPIIESLEINLRDVAQAVPSTSANGEVSALAVEVDAEVLLVVNKAAALKLALEAQVSCAGGCMQLPNLSAAPLRVQLRSQMIVWWHIKSGVLRGSFMREPRPPQVAICAGAVGVAGHDWLPPEWVSARVSALVEGARA